MAVLCRMGHPVAVFHWQAWPLGMGVGGTGGAVPLGSPGCRHVALARMAHPCWRDGCWRCSAAGLPQLSLCATGRGGTV